MKKDNYKLPKNIFDKNMQYKLYRNIYEIIHPTISKKNISDYKIIINDNLCPLRIFYPNRISSIESIIIFIHGEPTITECNSSYAKICNNLAKECNKLVIALDYTENSDYKFPETLNNCYDTIKYLYKELENQGIKNEKIILMGDSIGGNLSVSISLLAKEKKEFQIKKQILIYPILYNNFKSLENNPSNILIKNKIDQFFNHYISKKSDTKNKLVFPFLNNDYSEMPDTLMIVGKTDFTNKENIEFYQKIKNKNKNTELLEPSFALHGFLNEDDKEIMTEFYSNLNSFLTF